MGVWVATMMARASVVKKLKDAGALKSSYLGSGLHSVVDTAMLCGSLRFVVPLSVLWSIRSQVQNSTDCNFPYFIFLAGWRCKPG